MKIKSSRGRGEEAGKGEVEERMSWEKGERERRMWDKLNKEQKIQMCGTK